MEPTAMSTETKFERTATVPLSKIDRALKEMWEDGRRAGAAGDVDDNHMAFDALDFTDFSSDVNDLMNPEMSSDPAVRASIGVVAPHLVDEIRAAGWTVAAHADFAVLRATRTFWIFTKGGHVVRGEGTTDREALERVAREIMAIEARDDEAA
jgi:hypothetical protein